MAEGTEAESVSGESLSAEAKRGAPEINASNETIKARNHPPLNEFI
jgi:hypothetical protein